MCYNSIKEVSEPFLIFKVAVLDINDTKGTALEKTLKTEFGEGRTVYRHCDVADKKQLEGICTEYLLVHDFIDSIVPLRNN